MTMVTESSWEDTYDELKEMTGRFWRVWKKAAGE